MRRAVLVAGLVVAVALTACGGDSGGDAGDAGGRVGVVASFYPLAEVAQRVGGDRVRVTNLTPAGGEPHDLELDSRDLDRLQQAEVVVFLGGGFQPAVEKATARARGQVIDVLDPADAGDPHVWLDPTRLSQIANSVHAALQAADPAGLDTYTANLQAYAAELEGLDGEFRTGLAQCDRRTVVTAHDAFGYLTRRYDLRQEAITGLSPEAEPDPRRLSQLADKVRAEGVTTVFYETLVSPKVAQSLAREAGVKTAVLDPIEGLTKDDAEAGKTYASIMRENLAALRAALGCR